MSCPKGRWIAFFALAAALSAGPASAGEATVVLDFERGADLARVRARRGIRISKDVSSHGNSSLKAENRDYLNIRTDRLGEGGRGDLLRVDFFNAGARPLRVRVELFDRTSKKGYWYRHVRSFVLRPGWNTLGFRVARLARGEKTSWRVRNSFLDPGEIFRMDVAFSGAKKHGFVYVDHIRFEPDPPMPEVAGLRAFDFGPENQAERHGFARSSRERYDKERGFGWSGSGWPRAVRDYAHPNDLLGDFREARGETFSIRVPNDTYHVRVFYEDHGRWMDQFADFKWRTIQAEGKRVYEQRLDEQAAAERYYRFADVEPGPDTDVYETYIRNGRYRPKTFEVAVTDGRLDVRFDADRGMVCRIAALVLWPAASDRAGRKWMAELHRRMQAEFEAENVYLGGSDGRAALDLPASSRADGFVVFSAGRTVPTGPTFVPAAGHVLDSVRLSLCPGQATGTCVSVHAVGEGGALEVAAKVAGPAVSVHRLQNRLRRQRGGYTIEPDIIRGNGATALGAGRTRQFWLEVSAASDARPGERRGTLTVRLGRREKRLPLVVEVLPFRLAAADFSHGLFGLQPDRHAPADAQERVIRLLRAHGMTAVGGVPLGRALVRDGELAIDFAEADRVMALLKEAGFRREVDTYGGPGIAGVNAAAKALGRPYWEVLKEVGRRIRNHAKAEGWLPVSFALVDEPHWSDKAVNKAAARVRKTNEAVPWVITNGYWTPRAAKPAHRRLMDELDRTMLGRPTREAVAYLKSRNKSVGYYGQCSRYQFGYRQWSALSAGFDVHYAWHLYIRYGDLYYDLDAREPDVCMIYYTPTAVRPSLRLKSIRAGVADFRYLRTLAAARDAAGPGAAADKARDVLDKVRQRANIYGRGRVEDADALRQEIIGAIRAVKRTEKK